MNAKQAVPRTCRIMNKLCPWTNQYVACAGPSTGMLVFLPGEVVCGRWERLPGPAAGNRGRNLVKAARALLQYSVLPTTSTGFETAESCFSRNVDIALRVINRVLL